MGQSWSKTNWAELIQTHANQKVKSKNHPNDLKHLLTYGNNPKTRVMVISINKENDEKLLNGVIMNSAQKKADLVEYSVVSVKDYVETTTNGNQFKKVAFLEKVKTVYRPTMFVINKKNQEVLEAYQALVGDGKIDEELTESDDGYVFFQSLDIVVPESEPVIRTFSVRSTGRGVKEDLTKLLKENKKSIPNDANTRVLVLSGSHGGRRKVKGKIDPVGGESGLSNEKQLNYGFYREDCEAIGIKANASHFDEDSNGDFDKWKTTTSFTRPDIRTVTPCNPLPAGSLLSDPDFDKIHFQVVDIENYHNRPELRGNVTESPAAALKRCEELVRDVVAYGPTVIFVAWCFSCNGDIALALRAEGVFSELIVEHELRSITGDPHAKLDSCQRDVLWEMCQDSVKHVVLAGPAGVGKTVVGCEGAKQEAAKLKKEHPEATVEIYVVSWLAGSGSEELYKVFSKKHFEGLSAFPVKYSTRFQLCSELGLDIKNYGADKSIDFILEVCKAKDKVNKEQENTGGGQQFTVLMVDEAVVKPTGDENVQDWTELGELESLSTVRTITCAQPSVAGVGAHYNVKLPSSSDARHRPTSFCTRLLNVGYRNSPAIRSFNNYLVDHVPGCAFLARGRDFKVGTPAPSSPAGTKGVEWIQCSRTEDLGRAARKAVEDCGSDNTVVLYGDREGEDVRKVAAEASTAPSVVDWRHYVGCESTKIIVVTNYGIDTEATTRAREKLVMVTGPGLYSGNNHILSEAAASGHVYRRFSERTRCGEDPCGWSRGCLVGEFPLLEHKLFCPTQDCGMFGASEDKCPKCGWELEWSRLCHMSLNGQLLAYLGQQTFWQRLAKRWFGLGKKDNVGLAQAKSPLATGRHYFEIEIIDAGSNREIAIGLAGKNYPENKLPGWREGSIGYHADDGKIFVGRGMGDPFGPLCNKGDIMGCGIRFPRDNKSKSKEEKGASVEASKDYHNKSGEDEVEQEVNTHREGKVQVYFTRNREIVGFKEALVPEGGFFPTVGMRSYGAKVKVDLKPDCGPVLMRRAIEFKSGIDLYTFFQTSVFLLCIWGLFCFLYC